MDPGQFFCYGWTLGRVHFSPADSPVVWGTKADNWNPGEAMWGMQWTMAMLQPSDGEMRRV